MSPHILIGASSSSNTGWLMNISLALRHSDLISFSAKVTCFPGRQPRTSSNLSMIESISIYSKVMKYSFECRLRLFLSRI